VSAVTPLQGVEEALALLGRLDESDRRWILEHLPPAAKARLASYVGGNDSTSRLAAAEAGRLVEILRTEPAWLIHAVLSERDWPWQAEVLESLPATVRLEVVDLGRRGVTLAKSAADYLLRAVCERMDASLAHDARELPFDSWVSNFSQRMEL
jgi:hypothetical protein